MGTADIAAQSRTAEMRIGTRYPVRAEVVCIWEDVSGKHQEARGHTRDISRSGICVISRGSAPSLFASVQVQASLPSIIRSKPHGWSLVAQGWVVRVEPMEDGEIAFALAAETMFLRSRSMPKNSK